MSSTAYCPLVESFTFNLIYAHILGMLGDPTGAKTLADVVKSRDWDKGWNYTGMGQFGMSMSELDSLSEQIIDDLRDNIASSEVVEALIQKELNAQYC